MQSDRVSLELQLSPNFSTSGLPAFAVVLFYETDGIKTKLSAVTSADVVIKTKYSTHSTTPIKLGHGLFSVTNSQFKIHISQSDMDTGIPMGCHLLGTVNATGQIILLDNVSPSIQAKYDYHHKTTRIDLTFVISEGKIDTTKSDIEI